MIGNGRTSSMMMVVGRIPLQRPQQQPEDLAQCRTDEDGGVDQEKKKVKKGAYSWILSRTGSSFSKTFFNTPEGEKV